MLNNFIKTNINNLLLFSIILSFLNLSLIVKLYFSELGLYKHIFSNFFNLDVDEINITQNENLNTSEIETNIEVTKLNETKIEEVEVDKINIDVTEQEKTITFKEKFKDFPWAWIGFIFLIFLGFYLYSNYYISENDLPFREGSDFKVVSELLEGKEKYLSKFEKGSEQYFIEKIKYTHIRNAIF